MVFAPSLLPKQGVMTTESLLQEAITAVKSGQKAAAKALLLQLIDADEQNETAWLWLSAAVETDEDRRICLENVLTLNPENRAARRGLARLQPAAADGVNEQVVRREYIPLSAAAEILYPERQVKEWVWRDPTPDFPKSEISYEQKETLDDVWSQDVEICAYCAAQLEFTDTRCPQCRRRIVVHRYQYPKPSNHLIIFWVLLFGVSQSYLLLALYDILAERNYVKAALHIVFLVVTFVLGVAAYTRRHWAFLTTLIFLVLTVVTGVVEMLLPAELFAAEWYSVPLLGDFLQPFAGSLGQAARLLNMAGAGLALVYAIFLVGPDFAREETRQVATLPKRLRTGADYHQTARRLRDRGLWATAVLHWQRALALEPHQLGYYQHLGVAYSHLGFFTRARDVLQAGKKRASHADMQQKFIALLALVDEKEQQDQQKKAT